MKLYDNDSHRDAFTELVYDLLNDDPTWDRANQIIESFDGAPAVEVPDTTLGGTYVNIEWLKRAEAELKKYKELAQRPQGGPCDAAIEIVKPTTHTYLKPCRICGNTEVIYEKYRHDAGPRWRCWCTKCLACIDPGWAQSQSAIRDIWNQEPQNDPLTLDQLREMDGEPVFIVHNEYGKGWCIIDWHGVNKSWFYFSKTGTAEGMTAVPVTAEPYGETWLAYRRKPEGGCQT